jgi:hypothetical protein
MWEFMLVMASLFMHLGQANLFGLMTCEKPTGKKDSMAPEESSQTNFTQSLLKIRGFHWPEKTALKRFFLRLRRLIS